MWSDKPPARSYQLKPTSKPSTPLRKKNILGSFAATIKSIERLDSHRRASGPIMATVTPSPAAPRLPASYSRSTKTKTQRLYIDPSSWRTKGLGLSAVPPIISPSERDRLRNRVMWINDDSESMNQHATNSVLSPAVTPSKKADPVTPARPSLHSIIATPKYKPATPAPFPSVEMHHHSQISISPDLASSDSSDSDEEMHSAGERQLSEQVQISPFASGEIESNDFDNNAPPATQDAMSEERTAADISAQLFHESSIHGRSETPNMDIEEEAGSEENNEGEEEKAQEDDVDIEDEAEMEVERIRVVVSETPEDVYTYHESEFDQSNQCPTLDSKPRAGKQRILDPETDEELEFYKLVGHRPFDSDPNRFELLVCWKKGDQKADYTWVREEEIQLDAAGSYFQYWRSVGGRQTQVADPDLWYMFSVDRSRGTGRDREFLVSWLGSKEQSWEPLRSVRENARKLLEEFEMEQSLKEGLGKMDKRGKKVMGKRGWERGRRPRKGGIVQRVWKKGRV